MENPDALSNKVFNVADESNVFFIVMVCTQYRPIIGSLLSDWMVFYSS